MKKSFKGVKHGVKKTFRSLGKEIKKSNKYIANNRIPSLSNECIYMHTFLCYVV